MVSKIAVMALVAIVAAPILLGYAFNLQETTETSYKVSEDPINVTDFLNNGEHYSNALADVFKLNTNFTYYTNGTPMMPYYQSIVSTTTTMPQHQDTATVSPDDYVYISWSYMTSDFYFHVGPDDIVQFIDLESGVIQHNVVNGIRELYYNKSENKVYYRTTTDTTGSFTPYDLSDLAYFKNTGSVNVTMYLSGTFSYYPNHYVDLSAGFKSNIDLGGLALDVPDYTKSFTMTINLDSMTGSYVRFTGQFLDFSIHKTTEDGQTVFYVKNNSGSPDKTYIYYDTNKTDNTYQLNYKVEYSHTGDLDERIFDTHIDFNYVGSWPSLIGESNYYLQYQFDRQFTTMNTTIKGITSISIYHDNAYSPILRMDKAIFEGFTYRTIENVVYSPSAFKTNPSTTITNVVKYGSSLTFGSTTYNITNGNITLGTHQISLSKAVFDSVPIDTGYQNRINGVVVSTTLTPATITFNGIWSATVTTQSMESTTYTNTEWTPGQFAWNGIDDNFLMAGLFTITGVFIGLGIYAKARRLSIWPLLIVCGGAAALFLFMI